jgi:glyoxylase-like metal-dependent hydrolase (beta-lactamase superfamily II)
MEVMEIAPGLWRWTTRHPEWTPDEGGDDGWDPEVGCVYYEAADAVVLVDPLVPADVAERERFWRSLDRDVAALDRPIAILLTVFWHERSAAELALRYPRTSVWAHTPAIERLEVRVTNPFAVGDPLPAGLQAFDAKRRDEVVYWMPEHSTLVAGDVLLGDHYRGVRVCPDSWLPDGVTSNEFRASLRPLLELPVERVLVSHGEPVLENGRDALDHALA